MNRMRLSIALAIAALSLAVVVPQAGAWEFSMDGTYTWELETIGQLGNKGFFGPYDVDAGAGPTVAGVYAPYNFWLGDQDVGTPGCVSGADASWQTIYMGVNMQLRMNKALRVRGLYYIGSWGPGGANGGQEALPVASEYLNQSFPGIQRSFSPGYWNTLWLSAQLPWGSLSLGKRPSAWGTGLSYNGTESRSSESLSLTTYSGPFRIGLSFYPSRRGNAGPQYYNRDLDKNNSRIWDMTIPNVTYRCGPIDMGIIYTQQSRHSGGEAVIDTPAARATNTFVDRDDLYGGIYFKYYTGTIFFNSEVQWYQQTQRNRLKLAGGGPSPGTRDTHIENWRYMLEIAALAGPARFALLHAWLQGDDRRGGQFLNGAQNINNVTYIDKRGTLRSNSFANSGLFRPYSLLQAYTYGMGMFVNGDTGNGYIEDAVVYGARADYAVAANLNVYGTFFYAERQSKSGFGWGCIAPDTTATDGSIVRRGIAADRVGAPNIPDTSLGWEIDAGFNWQLLEGLSASGTFGYWKPGAWYKFACIDRSVVNWDIAGATGSTNPAAWGINPTRDIDGVWAMQLVVNGSF